MATFNVKTEGNIINVEVEVPAADPKRLNRNPSSVVVDDVLDYLSANGVEVVSCLKQQTLTNRGKNPRLSGTFSFQKKESISVDKAPKPKKEEVIEDTSEATTDEQADYSAKTEKSSTKETKKSKKNKKRKKVYSEYSQQQEE